MEAGKIRLLEFIGSSKRTFNIPVYQRNYDWKEEQCKRLFYDIEHIALKKYTIVHFLGTFVYVKGLIQPNFLEFIVIDGQQRITSIMLLIKALYDSIKDCDLKEDILETYLINRRAPENLRIKLKPIESDMIAYEQIFENGNPYYDSNITKNYRLFKDLISKSHVSAESLYKALSYVEVVYIALDENNKSENPQLIFESLNSTGLSLTQADLIRNFLLMNHDYEEQNRLYKTYWLKIEGYLPNSIISDFVRDYLTMKTSIIPKKDKVYNIFKEYVQNNEKLDEENVLKDLLIYSEYYSWFINCNCNDETVNDLLQQLKQIKSTVTYPALLFLFNECFYLRKIDIENLVNILQIILSYLYRRLICEYPTNALNKIFANLPSELKKMTLSNRIYFDAINKLLTSKSGSGTFPRDEEFKNAFIFKDLYKTKIDKYTLYQLEKFNSKEVIDLNDNITVEHIMPQKLSPGWQIDLGKRYEEIHTKYLHTIGNLTLSGYNSELSNKRFTEKKEWLLMSNISISRNLSKFSFWNDETIKNRAEELFKIADQIWYLPKEYNNITGEHPIDYKLEYNIMDDLNVTGEKPKQLVILNQMFTVDSWKDVLKQICKCMYDLDSETFKSFTKNKDFEGRDKRTISDNCKGMTSPFKLSDNIFIETNLNANAILNYCKLIVEKYDIQNDVSFMLRQR